MCLFLISHACFIVAYAGRRTLSTHGEKWLLPCIYVWDKDGRTLLHSYISTGLLSSLIRIFTYTLESVGGFSPAPKPYRSLRTSWKISLSEEARFPLSSPNTRIDSWWEWIRNMSFCRDYYPSQPISQALMMTADGPSNFCSCWAKAIGQALRPPERQPLVKRPVTRFTERFQR